MEYREAVRESAVAPQYKPIRRLAGQIVFGTFRAEPRDRETLEYAMRAYGHVLNDGSLAGDKACDLEDFARAIEKGYDQGEPRNAAVVDALRRAHAHTCAPVQAWVYKDGAPGLPDCYSMGGNKPSEPGDWRPLWERPKPEVLRMKIGMTGEVLVTPVAEGTLLVETPQGRSEVSVDGMPGIKATFPLAHTLRATHDLGWRLALSDAGFHPQGLDRTTAAGVVFEDGTLGMIAMDAAGDLVVLRRDLRDVDEKVQVLANVDLDAQDDQQEGPHGLCDRVTA